MRKIRVGDVVRYTDEARTELGSLADDKLHVVTYEEHGYFYDGYGEYSFYQWIQFEDETGCDAAWVEVVKRANIFQRILAYLNRKR